MDPLQHMFDLQKEFEKRWFDFDSINDDEKQHLAIEFIGHIFEELAEVRAEIPLRKHWKSGGEVNIRKLKLELVDVLHFFITVCLIFDLDANDIYDTFLHKHDVNNKRQDEWGYGKDKKKL